MHLISNIKSILRNCQYKFNELPFHEDDIIRLDWYAEGKNFGDVLNPILIGALTGKKILNINSKYCNNEHLMAIGSILDRSTDKTVVWGAGFISDESRLLGGPKKIAAVRGPKTKKRLLELGVECPSVFGDPALLLPYIFNEKIQKEYKIGIIPHYVDKESNWIKALEARADEGILVIDIIRDDPIDVVRDILRCEKIVSSSLHGLIVSDIPSLWVELSGNLSGGHFKFHDYFLSVNRCVDKPLVINEETKVEDFWPLFETWQPIDIDLTALIRAFPFELNHDAVTTSFGNDRA